MKIICGQLFVWDTIYYQLVSVSLFELEQN